MISLLFSFFSVVTLTLTTGSTALQTPRLPSLRTSRQVLSAQHQQHSVQVSYEGKSCEVFVGINETILTALERSDVRQHLELPELPSDCRRGNCLTCTGRHVDKSRQSNLRRLEDGLAPHISEEVAKRGYVLTCSSRVVGDGVKIELGENHKVWKAMFSDRLQDEETQLEGRAAMAKTIRKYDERHYDRWEKETKATLKKTEG
jgi:ferredoxin